MCLTERYDIHLPSLVTFCRDTSATVTVVSANTESMKVVVVMLVASTITELTLTNSKCEKAMCCFLSFLSSFSATLDFMLRTIQPGEGG